MVGLFVNKVLYRFVIISSYLYFEREIITLGKPKKRKLIDNHLEKTVDCFKAAEIKE